MTGGPLARIHDLHIAFGGTEVVRGVSLDVAAGECVALVGESGAGKSLTAATLLGLVPGSATITAATLEVDGGDVRGLGEPGWRRLRGARVGFIGQDALVALDPLRRVGREVVEAAEIHGARATRRERDAAAIALLDRVSVPEPELRARQYPHELSGGQRQRALIASALSGGPALLVADEPTSALDAAVRDRILDLLGSLREAGHGLLLISHDLAAVARLADTVHVMHEGRIVESGPTATVIGDPQHAYTRRLLDAVPAPRAARETVAASPVLEARGLTHSYGRRRVLDDVSFSVQAGRTLGLVGESGSGKSTVARLLLALERPDAGEVLLDGSPWSSLSESRRRPLRSVIQWIDQDSYGSLDPRWTVGRIVAEAIPSRPGRSDRVLELLRLVGLDERHVGRRPAELSGGQRQRVSIARALAVSPRVLVCDEAVSALDLSVQAQVLALLDELQERLGLAIVFISHDTAAVERMSDEIVVLDGGRIVESRRPGDPFR